MTAELTSGVGYWTPEGELVLEADLKCARSLSQETEGEIDSNCEEYGANDYPDEYDEYGDGDEYGNDDAYVFGNHGRRDGCGSDMIINDERRAHHNQQQMLCYQDDESYAFSGDDDSCEYDWERDLTDEVFDS